MKVRNIIAASVITAALALSTSKVAAADDPLTKFIDWLYDKRDQLQDTVNKSIKGVRDAMDEGGPRQPRPNESTGDYFVRMYGKYDRLYKRNEALFKNQQELLNADLKLLQNLPKDDPRRARITKEIATVSKQQLSVRKSMNNYSKRRKAFDDKIQDYKKRTGSYPPHVCASARGWHVPAGAKCNGTSTDPHAGSSGHGHPN